ncbi:carbohydrate porin [Vibrio sp. F13]|uniref:carbohydrate porin n=1 Tax=Vibrio sp. F13 TaxID=2070777 RepID=UPI0010BD4947|nr:carbohydrate porin [Vibrio sp. F13]TKF54666.1 carbohydrate porin [Vibrio sp. F13]
MKIKKLVVAVSLGIAGGITSVPVLSADAEFTGYLNLGGIYSDNKERSEGSGRLEQGIGTEGGLGNFRVGNETNWLEIGLRSEIYNDGVKDIEASWILGNDTGDWSNIVTQEAFVGARGIFESSPETRVWAGRRVDIKQELVQIDLKYWYNHEWGLGFEDIPFFSENIDLAFQFLENTYAQPTVDGGSVKLAPIGLDLRLHDYKPFYSLPAISLGLNYAFTPLNEEVPTGKDIADSGLLITLQNTTYWSKGVNILTLQYGLDGLASGMKDGLGVQNSHFLGLEHKGQSYGVFYDGEVWPHERWRFNWTLAYENLDLDNEYGRSWYSASLMPSYGWTDVHSTVFQFGYDQADAQAFEDSSNKTFKATIAQQIQPEFGFWARPIFRLAVSYVEQSQQWNNVDWNYGNPIAPSALLTKNTDELLFGFTMEAWW